MEIEHLAFHDFLTQLPNRRLFIDRLEYTLTIMTRSRSCAAVLFMDLDNFKPLNDLYGHAIGDLILGCKPTKGFFFPCALKFA